MQSFKRLIAYYREPGNWWRLVFVVTITVAEGVFLYATVQRTFSPTFMPHELREPSTMQSRFLNVFPWSVALVGCLSLNYFFYKRADFTVSWRIRMLEMIPADILLLACCYFVFIYP